MKIEEFENNTITELKAIVYDLMVKSQEVNKDMQLVNQVIANKELEPKEESKSEESK